MKNIFLNCILPTAFQQTLYNNKSHKIQNFGIISKKDPNLLSERFNYVSVKSYLLGFVLLHKAWCKEHKFGLTTNGLQI